MASRHFQPVLTYVRSLSARGTLARLSDRDLLDRFTLGRDEDAFSVVVERYANLVFGVCRRRLHDVQDAEDACQATFLVLARRAGSIRKRQALGSWLHGVAYRVAEQLRRDIARRRGRERPAIDMAQPDNTADISWREVRAVLDEELEQLPNRLRAPLVLCYLQGQTRDEAAQHLGWSEGTLRGRLQRGRQLLRTRLTRRGITLPAALVAATLADGSEVGAAPAMLIIRTARAVAGAGTGSVPAAVLSTRVITLTEGVLKTMWISKVKSVTAVVVAAAMLGMGTGTWTYRTLAGPPQSQGNSGEQPAVDQARSVRTSQPGQKNTEASQPLVGPSMVALLKEDGHPAVQAVQFSPDGKRLAAGYANGTVALWDVASQRQIASFAPPELAGRDQAIHALAFAPDGRTLAVGTKNYTIAMWDARAGRLKGHLSALGDTVTSLAFSPDGKHLAVGSSPAGLRVWALADKRWGSQLEKRGSAAGSVAFAPDGKRLASASADGTVQLWDVATGRIFWRFQQGNEGRGPVKDQGDIGRQGQGASVAFAPDGKLLAVAGRAGQVLLLDAATGKAVRVLGADQGGSSLALAFAPDGRTLATANGKSGVIRLWDAATGKEIRALSDPNVLSLAFAPDGNLLASASGDGTVRLWTLRNGQLVLSRGAVRQTPGSDRLSQLVHELSKSSRSPEQQIDALYLAALGRFPTETEQDFSKARLAQAGDRAKALAEMLDMLTHTREFSTHVQSLARHTAVTEH